MNVVVKMATERDWYDILNLLANVFTGIGTIWVGYVAVRKKKPIKFKKIGIGIIPEPSRPLGIYTLKLKYAIHLYFDNHLDTEIKVSSVRLVINGLLDFTEPEFEISQYIPMFANKAPIKIDGFVHSRFFTPNPDSKDNHKLCLDKLIKKNIGKSVIIGLKTSIGSFYEAYYGQFKEESDFSIIFTPETTFAKIKRKIQHSFNKIWNPIRRFFKRIGDYITKTTCKIFHKKF